MTRKNYSEATVLHLAEEAYRNGEASFELEQCSAALIIIDMQREFVEAGLSKYWIPEATRMIPRLAQVLGEARTAKLPVIHTAFGGTHQYRDRPLSAAFMPNRYPQVAEGNFGAELLFPDALTPASDEILILKPSYGAFYDTPLDTILRNLGCDTVIITGTLTNLCCSTTARQAYERGYKVIFGADLTATNHPAIQEAEIQTLRYGFARIMSSSEIIEFIRERAK